MVIDLFGMTEKSVRQKFHEVHQHLYATVKPERDLNRRATYRENWWIFGEPRRELRPALAGLKRYIATVDTAKHRVFQFLDSNTVCDDKVVIIASADDHFLGILSSSAHLYWATTTGGMLEDRPVYVKSKVFDPFPFPDATPEQRATIAELAEELDATRKAALAEVPGLTMTEIYNLRGLLQSGEKLSAAQEDRARAARAGIVHRLHEQIDAAVADAYGWPADLSPSEIVTRLVALNAERAKEEAEGNIRWLRPDYQIPRFGAKK
jgi:hypothetical protein